MRYGSLFSGIEAATVAWHPLGWEPAWFAEIDKFPRAVLKHHYPDVPNLGDVTKVDWNAVEPVDLLVFGSPCQSFSVAGKRLGLDDPRGNLALYALQVVNRLRPRWFIFENVPGLLSSGGGRDFGAFLGSVGECGYQCAWRILDAQHFGVPQRRRRVFVVAHLGDWRRATAVLFERASMSGHPAPRREAGERVAPTLAARTRGGGGLGTEFDCDGGLVLPQGCSGPTAPTLNAAFGSKLGLDNQHIDSGAGLFVAHTLRAEGFDASEDGTGRGTPLVPTFAIQERAVCENPNAGGQVAVAFGGQMSTPQVDVELSQTLQAKNPQAVATPMAVRRITPVEAERLQGFPDNYTRIPYRGKPAEACPDGPRYKALGNSFAVPVVRWLGERIQMVEDLCNTTSAKDAA